MLSPVHEACCVELQPRCAAMTAASIDSWPAWKSRPEQVSEGQEGEAAAAVA
jgi:hypothetical protein